MSKLVVVLGATGGQGGSVILTLLKDGSYNLRGLCRDPSSQKAQALTEKGIEMVKVNIDDEESLIAAFNGANYIFAMTDYFDLFFTQPTTVAMATEYSRGINMAKAASKIPTLEHYIWSTLPNAETLSKGRLKIPHTDAKSQVDEYIKQDPELLSKTTFLWPALFLNVLAYPTFVPNFLKSAGKYVWLQPVHQDTPLAFLGDHTVNTGLFVRAIFSKPELTLNGKYVLASVETLSMKAIVEKWSAVTGKESVYVPITLDDYENLWPKFGTEVGLALKLFELCGDQSWSSQPYIEAEKLGIENDLVGFDESLKAMDLTAV